MKGGVYRMLTFDSEKMLSRNDVEIYSIPSWKYNVYYMVLCILLIINVGLVYWGGKKEQQQLQEYIPFFY